MIHQKYLVVKYSVVGIYQFRLMSFKFIRTTIMQVFAVLVTVCKHIR